MSPRPKFLTKVAFAFIMWAAATAPALAERTVPYWASIRLPHKAHQVEANMRVGPGEDYRINWVYHRAFLPVKVVRIMEGWRLIEDPDGARGWMLALALQPARGAIIQAKELAEMREKADPASRLLWRLEPGVTGKLGDCTGGWCHFQIDQRGGYVPQAALWGAGEP
ncbi:MAG: SH3 domain-containing protein [Novosphingobium sp.]